jgi:uroporphyrinogen-III synthase
MRVLLTRPRAQSERLATILRRRGHEAIFSPLMEIRFVEGAAAIDLAGVHAILATSANGIRALSERTPQRDIPVFAVGPQTAAAAKALGFGSVKDAQGGSLNLAKAVGMWATPDSGTLVHPTGSDYPPQLARALAKKGFRVRTEVVYETIVTPILTEEAVAQLQAQGLGAVMLFSPRSARLFVTAVETAGLEDSVKGLRAVCISSATAEALGALELHSVAIASSPNQDSLIALLEKQA